MHLTLKLVNGEILEESVESNVCIIGRSVKCTVVVPHDGMSRQHCQVDVIDGEYFVTDLGSTNGVFIDGQKIEPHQKTPYQTFLTLSFGAVQSLVIENEEPVGGSIKASAPNRRETSKESATSLTKTKAMPDQNKTPAAAQANWKPKTNIKGEASKTQSMVINITVVLIIAAAAWWYIQKEDVVEGEAPVIHEETQSPKEAPAKAYEQF